MIISILQQQVATKRTLGCYKKDARLLQKGRSGFIGYYKRDALLIRCYKKDARLLQKGRFLKEVAAKRTQNQPQMLQKGR
jgi:hypothetical protein